MIMSHVEVEQQKMLDNLEKFGLVKRIGDYYEITTEGAEYVKRFKQYQDKLKN